MINVIARAFSQISGRRIQQMPQIPYKSFQTRSGLPQIILEYVTIDRLFRTAALFSLKFMDLQVLSRTK